MTVSIPSIRHEVSKDWEFFVQLRSLMYRNFLIKRRRWIATLFEIVLPLLVILIMIGIQAAIRSDSDPNNPQDLHLEDRTIFDRSNLQAQVNGALGITINEFNLTAIEEQIQEQFPGQTLPPREVIEDLAREFGFTSGDGTERIIALAPDNELTQAFQTFLETPNQVDYPVNALPDQPLLPEDLNRVRVFADSDAIDDYITDIDYGREGADRPLIYFAIVFDDVSVDNQYSYTIRGKATGGPGDQANSPPTNEGATRNNTVQFAGGNYVQYVRDGWIYMQDLVDVFLIKRAMGENGQNPDDFAVPQYPFIFQPFPVPPFFNDAFAGLVGNLLPLIYTLFYLFAVTRIVKSMVEEKELRIKENMKMMGLQESVLTVSWFLTYLLIFLVIAALTVLISMNSLYEFSSGGYIFWFFFSFGLGVFAFCYLMSAFFTRARIAAVLSAIIFLLSFFPIFALDSEEGSTSQKLAGCLSLPMCFGLGVAHLAEFESTSIGINSGNAGVVFRNFSMNACFGMMILDFFLYMILGWYFGKVLPSKYGSHSKWYFFLQPSYWSKAVRDREAEQKKKDTLEYQRLNEEESPIDLKNFEEAGDDLKSRVGISVRGLRKVFGEEGTASAVPAVKGTNLEMFEGQILSLLGHNGAGKTTTINMLTGFYPPTSGDAFMLGSTLTTDMNAIRKKMGVCPQHDVLYPILTVREHLDIYASIKGVKRSEKKQVVDEMIQLIGLSEAADRAAGALSGGMKRKLSVGLALIGDSKIIFLDEPTSGMDTYSRQQFWDLIKSQKEGRTIVLTTHYMDEADYLGDRIAIMSEGNVKCWGTSLFLKNRYGVGYTMTLTKKEHCDEKQITSMVLDGIKGATKLTNVATEMSFRLPFDSSHQFPDLFAGFDEDPEAAGIESYGISVTTLDEVFLRVSNEATVGDDTPEIVSSLSRQLSSKKSLGAAKLGKVFSVARKHDMSGPERVWRHFRAMLIRRAIGARRDYKVFICMCLIPFVILLAGVGILSLAGAFSFPSLEISSREMFNSPNIVSYYNGNQSRGDLLFDDLLTDLGSPLYEGEPYERTDIINSSRGSMQLSLLNNLKFEEFPQPEWEGASQYLALMFDMSLTGEFERTDDDAGIRIDAADGEPLQVIDGLFFNTTARHGAPAIVNTYYNLLGRNLTGNSDFKLTVTSFPFPQTAEERTLQTAIAGIFIGIAFAFIPAVYVAWVVKDRSSKSKHQQLVSGASPLAYWLSTYAWDLIFYVLPMLTAIAVFGIYGLEQLVDGDNFGASFLLLLLYGFSVAPFSYLCSFIFGDHTTAQSVMLFVGLIGGAILPVVWIIMGIIESTVEINDVLLYFYLLLPPFALASGTTSLLTRGINPQDPFAPIPGPLDWEVATRPIVFMLVTAVVYFALVLLIETIQTTPRWYERWDAVTSLVALPRGGRFSGADLPAPAEPDEDVLAEAERVNPPSKEDADGEDANGEDADAASEEDAGPEPDKIRLLGLRKEFGSKVAVHNLSFGVPKGQVFGFLGTNGAGKTTSLKMLTADILPTAGEAFILGNAIATEQRTIRQSLGYCPQFDALIDNLTAREHLTLYCRLKGVDEDSIADYVTNMLSNIGLDEWADKRAVTYSGGTKRKLSLGMALVGDPEVVFLDEPSTGMDPGSRRFMWDLITGSMANRSVILTTHSMDEATALCERIGIMVNGQLRCLGSVQHLKYRYGSGYQIDVNVPGQKETIERLRSFISSRFEGAQLIEQHGGSMKFRVARKGNKLSEVFRLVEENKDALEIAEYSVSETTLEQIFNSFAKQQEEDSREAGPR